MSTSTRIQIYCGTCKRDTNHVVLSKKDMRSHPDSEYWWHQTHHFLQCAGCDAICYAVETTTEDDLCPGERVGSTWKTYPSREGERHPIDRMYALPLKVRVIYDEVIDGINMHLAILPAVGLRTLIEAICRERGITGRNLMKMIDKLSDKGILSANQAEILHSHRFLGNVAAHEIEKARREELLAALEIAESMLKTIYILPKLSDEIVTGKPVANS